MKKTMLTILSAICLLNYGFSQDTITNRSKENTLAKILEVGQSEIKYKRFDNPDGPIFTVLKSDILMIHYANGTKSILGDDNNAEGASLSEEELYRKGQTDATKYYEGYKGAGTGTLITSLLSPAVGLIPAIACGSTYPKNENLDYPNSELIKNPKYYEGYAKKAKRIKQNKVWTNWGIAFAINVFVILSFSSGH